MFRAELSLVICSLSETKLLLEYPTETLSSVPSSRLLMLLFLINLATNSCIPPFTYFHLLSCVSITSESEDCIQLSSSSVISWYKSKSFCSVAFWTTSVVKQVCSCKEVFKSWIGVGFICCATLTCYISGTTPKLSLCCVIDVPSTGTRAKMWPWNRSRRSKNTRVVVWSGQSPNKSRLIPSSISLVLQQVAVNHLIFVVLTLVLWITVWKLQSNTLTDLNIL